MTLAATQSRVIFDGDGSTSLFPFQVNGNDVIFADPTEVVVFERSAAGAISQLTQDVHYELDTVESTGLYTGSLTRVVSGIPTPLPDDAQWLIYRYTPPAQETDLINLGDFSSSAVEGAFDYRTRVEQDLWTELGRTLRKDLFNVAFDADDHRLTGLADGTEPTDAVTLQQLADANFGTIEYPATVIGYDPAPPLTSTNLQDAIDELVSLLGGTTDLLDGFVQAGTGAVARTWTSKVREQGVSITDFGAVDGAANNTAAITNAAAAAAGKTLIIPAGTFLIRAAIPLYSNTRVYMEPGAIIKLDAANWTGDMNSSFAFRNAQHDLVHSGTWDATSGVFPGGGTAQAKNSYMVTVPGTVSGVRYYVGDRIVALVNNASTSVYAGNWTKGDTEIHLEGHGFIDQRGMPGYTHAWYMRFVGVSSTTGCVAQGGGNFTSFLGCFWTRSYGSIARDTLNAGFDHWDGAYGGVVEACLVDGAGAQGIQFTGCGSFLEARNSANFRAIGNTVRRVRNGSSNSAAAIIFNANASGSTVVDCLSMGNIIEDCDIGWVESGAGGRCRSIGDTFKNVDQLPVFLQAEDGDAARDPNYCWIKDPVFIDCDHASGNIALISVSGDRHRIEGVRVINSGAAAYQLICWFTSLATNCYLDIAEAPNGSGGSRYQNDGTDNNIRDEGEVSDTVTDTRSLRIRQANNAFSGFSGTTHGVRIFNDTFGTAIEGVDNTLALSYQPLRIGGSSVVFTLSGVDELVLSTTAFAPSTSDGNALGTATNMWSDLFLAGGSVINWNNGDVTLTHSANALAGAGGRLFWSYDGGAGAPPVDFTNNTNNASVEVLRLQGDRATPGANDTAFVTMKLSDSAGNQDDFARLVWRGTTVTSGAEIANVILQLMNGGSVADRYVWTPSAFSPTTNDQVALGAATLSFADLYLANGAVINWNNGDVTMAHAADTLTIAGATTVALSGATFFNVSTTASFAPQILVHNQASDSSGPYFLVRKSRGSGQVNVSDALGAFLFSGYDTAGVAQNTVFIDAAVTAVGSGSVTADLRFIATGTLGGNPALRLRGTDGAICIGAGNLLPDSNNGSALGSTSNMWSDLFLADGSVINWNNGDMTLTHSSNGLTLRGGVFHVAYTASFRATNNSDSAGVEVLRLDGDRATPANNDNGYVSMRLSDSAGDQDEFARLTWQGTNVTSASETGILGLSLVSAGTLATRYVWTATTFRPNANDGAALGTGAESFADLFLASGGVINWANGLATLTHDATADALAVGAAWLIQAPPSATPPTLATNGQFTMTLTANTNMRISARGSDGVTRVANITLA